MPVPLEPGDRRFLIVAGSLLLIVLVVVMAIAPPAEPSFDSPSSYSTASGGAKAAFLLLKELGYPVERWELPFAQLPSPASGTVLILAEPWPVSSAAERHAIHAFLRAGGRVLATGPSGAVVLPQGGALNHDPRESGWKKYRAVIPSPLARGAPEITLAPNARWNMAHYGHLGIYADGRNSVVVSYRYGRGEAVWWAAATPLTNAGIQQPGNLELLLNTLGPPGQTRVLWDEYYHGQHGSLWSYFARTPAPWGLLQFGLVALAVLITFARRSGPVRPRLTESRLAPLEFVETLGDLYHRAHAASSAVATCYQRFRYLLARRLGLPTTATTTQLHEATRERLGWTQPGLLETLQRAERATRNPDLSDEEALELVQAIEHYAGLLQLRPQTQEVIRRWPNK